MKCLSSQLIITESSEILRNSYVRFDNLGLSYHNVLTKNHETARTIFQDGIISPPVISVSKLRICKSEIEKSGYELLSFEDLILRKKLENRKTIIDFATEEVLIINRLIKNNYKNLSNINSLDFIIACTVSPLLFLESSDKMVENRLIWSGTNLIDKKITGQTSVSIVSIR